MTKKSFLFSSLCAIFLFIGCGSDSEINENLVANTDKNKPEIVEFQQRVFNLKTVDGKDIVMKNTKDKGMIIEGYTGTKAVLVDVFTTWCPTCIKSIPALNSVRNEYTNEFEIISVLFEAEEDVSKKDLEGFIAQHKVSYPVLYGDKNFELRRALGNIQAYPELFLFDKNGKFIRKLIGEHSQEELTKYIKEAIANK